MILNKSAIIYHTCLKTSSYAKGYLKKRGITSKTIKKFLLGYCEFNIASKKLLRHYTIEQLEKSGIFHKQDDRIYDMFNGRITIPIMINSEVNYMTSRLVNNGQVQHLHQKGNIELAVNHNILTNTDKVVIVEGPFDCFALDQLDIPSIGLLGAHRLTRQIITDLYDKEIYICLDNDKNQTGYKASKK